MADEYTPTTEQVRSGYVWLSAGDNPGAQEEASEDFDRWVRGVLADAWDEGFEEPRECCGLCPLRSCPWDNGGNGPTNPYREEN